MWLRYLQVDVFVAHHVQRLGWRAEHEVYLRQVCPCLDLARHGGHLYQLSTIDDDRRDMT